MLDDGDARGDGRGAFGIGGAKDGDDGEADGGGNVHGSGIVAEEKMALGEEAGEFGDGGLAGEIDWSALKFGGDGGGDRRLRRECRRE